MDLVLNPKTEKLLGYFLANPGQSLLLQGPRGSGKSSIVKWLASNLLSCSDKLVITNPFFLLITPDEKKLINIDKIRQINNFLSTKVPDNQHSINRIVAIDNADFMSLEAQNALLKNLEEPPVNTLFLLTTSVSNKLLPTIKSRLPIIKIIPPSRQDIQIYLQNKGLKSTDSELAINISSGLSGLASEIANNLDNHPLIQAATITREILTTNQYQKLVKINEIYKDKELLANIFALMQQMAKLALEKADNQQFNHWNNVLSHSYIAANQLNNHVNPKLILTELMLNI